ncbi:hypothetical protein F8B43_3921 [Methylorubrum populi]|uniref:Uncharacterized protein n=1 Tax=Methylorubrum populi TaxID=223967 RepID=A0A833J3I3_9HYPH|nr:hypothetical protein F8B43_3921 [Methylorubrum populi]
MRGGALGVEAAGRGRVGAGRRRGARQGRIGATESRSPRPGEAAEARNGREGGGLGSGNRSHPAFRAGLREGRDLTRRDDVHHRERERQNERSSWRRHDFRDPERRRSAQETRRILTGINLLQMLSLNRDLFK